MESSFCTQISPVLLVLGLEMQIPKIKIKYLKWGCLQ